MNKEYVYINKRTGELWLLIDFLLDSSDSKLYIPYMNGYLIDATMELELLGEL